MKIVKINSHNDFKVGTFYSLLGLSRDILMAKFVSYSERGGGRLVFQEKNGDERVVLIGKETYERGYNVVEHDFTETLWYIQISIDFVIHSFDSKDEAETFFQANKKIIYQLEGEVVTDHNNNVIIATREQLTQAALEIFFDQVNGNTSYEPVWIEKTKDLKSYINDKS